MIGSPTGIKDIFRDIDAATEVVADSDQFNQGTAASLMEVVIMEMMMREKTVKNIKSGSAKCEHFSGIAEYGHSDWGLGFLGCRYYSSLSSSSTLMFIIVIININITSDEW